MARKVRNGGSSRNYAVWPRKAPAKGGKTWVVKCRDREEYLVVPANGDPHIWEKEPGKANLYGDRDEAMRDGRFYTGIVCLLKKGKVVPTEPLPYWLDRRPETWKKHQARSA